MGLVGQTLERISSRVDKALAIRYREQLGLYTVGEHPRAGGTWLCDMLADYLQIPFPKNNRFPLGCTGVIHHHWRYTPRLDRAVYVYRDGRDVAVSLFFYCTRPVRSGGDPGKIAYLRRRYPYLLEPGTNLDDCAGWMPRFLGDRMRRPYGCRISWPVHVREWALGKSNVLPVSYESLRADAAAALTRVIEWVTEAPADPERVTASVDKFTFARQTGRKAGQENRSDAKRKGAVGDWRNHFTREAGEIFEKLCPNLLVELGYESSTRWWEELPDHFQPTGPDTNSLPRTTNRNGRRAQTPA